MKTKVGVPRALYFYRDFPLWEGILTGLDCEVIVSPETSKEILKRGTYLASDELCVPMKIYFGHVDYLTNNHKLDYVFTPRYVMKEKDYYYCPKFLNLPETTKYSIKSGIQVLTWELNIRKNTPLKSTMNLGKKLKKSAEQSIKAHQKGLERMEEFKNLTRKGVLVPDALNKMYPDYHLINREKSKYDTKNESKRPLEILLISHPYNAYENIITQDLFGRLESYYVNVHTIESLNFEVFKKKAMLDDKLPNYWENEEELLQAAHYCLNEKRDEIDGAIFLISFLCGPDSLDQEIIMRDFKKNNVPFLSLNLDEHKGDAALITRLETFAYTVRMNKYWRDE